MFFLHQLSRLTGRVHVHASASGKAPCGVSFLPEALLIATSKPANLEAGKANPKQGPDTGQSGGEGEGGPSGRTAVDDADDVDSADGRAQSDVDYSEERGELVGPVVDPDGRLRSGLTVEEATKRLDLPRALFAQDLPRSSNDANASAEPEREGYQALRHAVSFAFQVIRFF